MIHFSGYLSRLKEKTGMTFLEDMIQEEGKVDLRIQERQVYAGKRNFIE